MTSPESPSDYGNERDMLIAFNNLQRQTMLWKLEGLTDEQLRSKHQPSGMSLLGLLKHLVRVEQTWFAERLAGQESRGNPNTDDAWNPTDTETFDVLSQQYREAYTRSNQIASELPLVQRTLTPGSSGDNVSLQWVLMHMLEETARHLGHADFIRESIDGEVGVSAEHEARKRARAAKPEER